MMRITKKPLPQTYELKEPQCFLRIDLRAINRFAYVSHTKQTSISSIARIFELQIQYSIDDYQKTWLISEVGGVLKTRQRFEYHESSLAIHRSETVFLSG